MTSKERQAYKSALKTYNHCCALCGYNVVELHHIIYRRNGLTVKENLIPLCKKCHMKVHTDQKYWTDVLLDMNRGHYGMIERNDLKKRNKWEELFNE